MFRFADLRSKGVVAKVCVYLCPMPHCDVPWRLEFGNGARISWGRWLEGKPLCSVWRNKTGSSPTWTPLTFKELPPPPWVKSHSHTRAIWHPKKLFLGLVHLSNKFSSVVQQTQIHLLKSKINKHSQKLKREKKELIKSGFSKNTKAFLMLESKREIRFRQIGICPESSHIIHIKKPEIHKTTDIDSRQ